MLDKIESTNKFTTKELNKIAEDIYAHKIFSSSHISDIDELHDVFVPLQYLSHDDTVAMLEQKITFMFEYIDKAKGQTPSGYPIFPSMHLLTQEEQVIMEKHYQKISK